MNINNIKAIFVDCDGTLTDGTYEYHDDGHISKRFHTRDMYALRRLIDLGFIVFIASACEDLATKHRMRISKIPLLYTGLVKKDALDIFLKEENLKWDEVAFIGDAEIDMECMQNAGFAACPRDAIPEVVQSVNYVATLDGGRGAVNEIARYICNLKKIDWFKQE